MGAEPQFETAALVLVSVDLVLMMKWVRLQWVD